MGMLHTDGLGIAYAPGATNVPVPPGFRTPEFNCPEGSDYDKSQDVGMCVGPAYDPIYSQATPGSPRTYYNLDGSVAGADTPAGPAKTLIPGISNVYVYGALAVLALLVMGRRR